MSNASIAPLAGEVKRTSTPSPRDTRDGYPRRPDVLRRMPLSCNLVFDVLRTYAMGEAVELTVRELAQMCRLSPRQTRRALARLHGAHLIRWQRNGPGRGHYSTVEVLWKNPPQRPRKRLQRPGDISSPSLSPRRAKPATSAGPAFSPAAGRKSSDDRGSFPQKKGAPQKSRSEEPFGLPSPYTQGFKAFSHPALRPQLTNRAHRWAMARLREAVRACPVPWPRRNRLLEAMGLALWRAIARGEVRTPEELAQVVRRLRAALWGEGLPQEARALHAWAGWKVRGILRDLGWEKEASTPTEDILARIRREREEAKRAWQEVGSENVTKPVGASRHSWLGSQGKAGLCGSKAPGATYQDSAGGLSPSISGRLRGEAGGEAKLHPHNLR